MAERDQLSEDLLEASKSDQSGAVLDLISRQANPSYSDFNDATPLHWASRYMCMYVCVCLANLLLSSNYSALRS